MEYVAQILWQSISICYTDQVRTVGVISSSNPASRRSPIPRSFTPPPPVLVDITTFFLFNSVLSVYLLHSNTSFHICFLPFAISNLSLIVHQPSYLMLPVICGIIRMSQVKSDTVPIPLYHTSSTYSSLQTAVATLPRGGKTDDNRMVDV